MKHLKKNILRGSKVQNFRRFHVSDMPVFCRFLEKCSIWGFKFYGVKLRFQFGVLRFIVCLAKRERKHTIKPKTPN